MIRAHTIILVNCIALLLAASGTVTAQETATASALTETTTAVTLTTTSESSNEMTYYGDVAGNRTVRIISVKYVDGTAVLVLESGLSRAVTMTAPTSLASTGAAAGNLARRPIPPGRTMIQIDSPEPRTTLVTSYSVENGQYTEIRLDDGSSTLIAGPLTGTGVRDAVIGGALGTSFSALLIVVRRRFGFHCDMEHVA